MEVAKRVGVMVTLMDIRICTQGKAADTALRTPLSRWLASVTELEFPKLLGAKFARKRSGGEGRRNFNHLTLASPPRVSCRPTAATKSPHSGDTETSRYSHCNVLH